MCVCKMIPGLSLVEQTVTACLCLGSRQHTRVSGLAGHNAVWPVLHLVDRQHQVARHVDVQRGGHAHLAEDHLAPAHVDAGVDEDQPILTLQEEIFEPVPS